MYMYVKCKKSNIFVKVVHINLILRKKISIEKKTMLCGKCVWSKNKGSYDWIKIDLLLL